ncbi:SIMPL domain-containing protein [Caulobacter sp. 17J65-9]|nr:SIMPL domain-containing protein [Caulobacter sp. 17J65-9]
MIAVMGNGSVEHAPDYAALKFEVVGEAKSETEALKALATRRDGIESGLSRLADAKDVRFETGEFEVKRVLPPECDPGDSYDPKPRLSTGACAPIGFVAQLDVTVQFRPAGKVGDAASLAVQLGARGVELGVSGVDDPRAMREAAVKAAFEDARAQAELLATASGAKLGPVLSINRGVDGENLVVGYAPALKAQARVLEDDGAAPLSPDVALKLTATPVVESTSLAVVFRLIR